MRRFLSSNILVAALAATGAVPAAAQQAPTACDVRVQLVEGGRQYLEQQLSAQLSQAIAKITALEAELAKLQPKTEPKAEPKK